MTIDELTRLTEQLLSGELSRAEVQALAAARLHGPYSPMALVPEPKVQLELMLLDAALVIEPLEAAGWWFRDVDFRGALAELGGASTTVPIGDGWRQHVGPYGGGRVEWQLSLGAPTSSLTERGVRLQRRVADQGYAERADLISPQGDWVMVLWHHPSTAPERSVVIVCGACPVREGVNDVLTLFCADVDRSEASVLDVQQRQVLDLEILLPSPHSVYRLDDNGQTFRVGRYASKQAADRVARQFEERGHRQSYWSEPA